MVDESSPWPEPNADEAAHSQKLQNAIVQIIAEQGPIPFSRYMQEALYSPGLGYYSAGARKFGAEGDFVTAPEISSLFAHCIANQASQVMLASEMQMLELGAGSGRLAMGVLTVLRDKNLLPERYLILEPSADLRERQKTLISEALPDIVDRVEWLDNLPSSFSGFVFGNEVMDAFAVERFSVVEGQVRQHRVDVAASQLCWNLDSQSERLSSAVRAIENDTGEVLAEGYTSEVNLLIKPWLASLGAMLTAGAVVLLDYGYPRKEFYSPERTQGTVRCYYRHRANEQPLFLPGLQDITSHVDFTSVVEAGVESGLELQGFTSQSQFLMACGLLTIAEGIPTDGVLERSRLSQEVQQLTMPGAMGESFCAIGFSREIPDLLTGFTGQDMSHRL